MKLRNKKTGEIREIREILIDGMFNVTSLAGLNLEWEDYEEPKGYWSISGDATIEHYDRLNENDHCKEIGNFFETEEEAKKAVEKLKALKRLKDKGFRFVGWQDSVSDNNPDMILFKLNMDAWEIDTCENLDLLFGSEE